MENNIVNPVQILTVKNKIKLFKGEEEATSIEVIQLEEVGFEIVSQKDLYQVGDKAVYIQPDYCLSDISLFESFLRPTKGSCKLGSDNRIRAIKFGLHKGDGLPVYSQGILLPIYEVYNYCMSDLNKELHESIIAKTVIYDLTLIDLAQTLKITKWEEPEGKSSGGLNVRGSKPFPERLYKTDETNINNLWNYLETKIIYPVELVCTEKIDGSSISIGVKDGKGFICSRNLEKPIFIKKVVGRKKKSFLQKLIFWKKFDLNIYKEELNYEDDFVKYGLPYLDHIILKTSGLKDICFRGELNGGSMKGSGNKNNPASKQPVNIQFFSVDFYEDFKWRKGTDLEFRKYVNKLNLNSAPVVSKGVFESKEQIENLANNYFKTNMIEGLVFRTLDTSWSAKFMNPEYDAKK